MRPFVGAIIGGALFGFASGDPSAAVIGAISGGLIAKVAQSSPPPVAGSPESATADWRTRLDQRAPELGAFLSAAVSDGIIARDVAVRLAEYRLRQTTGDEARGAPVAGQGVAPPATRRRLKAGVLLPAWPGEQPPRADTKFTNVIAIGTQLEVIDESGGFSRVLTDAGNTWWVATDRLPATAGSAKPAGPTPPAPARRVPVDRPPAPYALQQERPVPPPAARPAPRPAEPSALAVGMRRLGKAATGVWKTFSADVAIHTVTYLGVLLLSLVIFAFFGLGFYGDLVGGDRWRPWRPVAATAVPVLLFGIAWMLRERTGIPFTANAVGFVASLTLPIMMSSLFQDGAPWGPSDLEGPDRWFGYATVGALCAAIYALASRRSHTYAYLVGPGIWTCAGALGLFLEDLFPLLGGAGVSSLGQFTSDGISWLQMAGVLAAMALTLLVIQVLGRTGAVASAIVRSTVVVLPVVAVLAAAFAATPAISTGTSAESAGTAILALTGVVAVFGARAGFAWSDFGEGLRRWLRLTLTSLGILTIGSAWIATGWVGVPYPWVGLGLALYCGSILIALPALGLPVRSAAGLLRLAGFGGLALAAIGPGASVIAGAVAASALVAGELLPSWSALLPRVVVPPRTAVGRAAVIAGAWSVATVGAARLSGVDAAAAVTLGAGAGLAVARWVPGRFVALRNLSPLSLGFAVAGAVVALTLFGTGDLGRVALGGHLLAAAAVAALSSVPWLVRLPAVLLAGVPGVMLTLRATGWTPAVLDAAVMAVIGTGLLVVSWFRSDRLGLEIVVLGHLAVWAAPFVGVASDAGALVGLTAIAVTHLAAAVANDRERMAIPGLPIAVAATAHALVGAAVLPVVAVLAAGEIPWFAEERPRASLMMGLIAWLVAMTSAAMHTRRLRLTMTGLGGLLGVLAVAVAVPSTPELLATSWSATALLGWGAFSAGSPSGSVPAWLMALVATVLTGTQLGIGRSDLHEPLLVGAVALVAAGTAAHRRGEPLREWGLPPLFLGLVLLPAVVSLSIADGDRVSLAALGAAAVYAALIWALHTGAFAVLVAAMIAISYADLVPSTVAPLTEPLMWLPLAAAFLGVAAVQPRRVKGHWLSPVTPGLLTAAAALTGLAGAEAAGSSRFPQVLLGAAVLTTAGAARWRSWVAGYAALGLVAWSGYTAGSFWLPMALWFASAVVAADAVRRADDWARRVLAPAATVLAAAAYGAVGWWRNWSTEETLVAVGLAAAVCGVAAVALSLRAYRPRLDMWRLPLHALTQVGLVTLSAIGVEHYQGTAAAFGPVTLALLAEGAGFALWATVRAHADTIPFAAVLIAGGLSTAAGWMDLSVAGVVGYASIVAGLSAVGSVALLFATGRPRCAMWWPPTLVGSQVAGLIAAVAAGDAFDLRRTSATIAGLLAVEGVLLGITSLRTRDRRTLEVASALSVSAAGLLVTRAIADADLAALSVIGLAVLAAALMAATPSLRTRRDVPGLTAAWALTLGTPLAVMRFDAASTMVIVLAVGGVGIVAGAFIAGRWRLAYLGVLEWVTALLIWISPVEWESLDPNVIVIPLAVLLCAALAMERARARILGAVLSSDALRLMGLLEGAALGVTLLVAAWPAYGRPSTGHLLVLLGEGVVLVAWALFSRVKRRLALGMLGCVAVILYPLARLIGDFVSGGIGGAQVLAIGAAAAVILIVVGSLLERGRTKVGEVVQRLAALLEEWS